MTGIEALNAICAECQQDKGKIQVACPWRSISGDYCEEYETIKHCLERLAELEDKIEDGRLKEFPCKVGDKVYWVTIIEKEYELLRGEVESISIDKEGMWLRCHYEGGLSYWHKNLEKDWFLTKAEAEKKLKELKGKHE